MDSQERLASLDFESVHTPTLLNQMHLQTFQSIKFLSHM